MGSYYTIINSPFTVNAIVSSTYPANTLLSGTGLTNAIAGAISSFTVKTYDVGGNQRTTGGDSISVSITSTSYTLTNIQVFDN